jgi:ankyrin repeat protein
VAWPNDEDTRLVDVQNMAGFTPLHYAVWVGRKEAIQVRLCGCLHAWWMCLRLSELAVPSNCSALHVAVVSSCGVEEFKLQQCLFDAAVMLPPLATALIFCSMSVAVVAVLQALASYEASINVTNISHDYDWIKVIKDLTSASQ